MARFRNLQTILYLIVPDLASWSTRAHCLRLKREFECLDVFLRGKKYAYAEFQNKPEKNGTFGYSTVKSS